MWTDVLLVSGHGGKAALQRRYHTMLTYNLPLEVSARYSNWYTKQFNTVLAVKF